MNNNIFLTGFMGSGKSYWGSIWAAESGHAFHDLDSEIEKEFNLPVEQIFEKYGEDAFRKAEKDHLRQLGNQGKTLVACGGGTPCFFDNLEWMKEHGIVIYLKASPEYILARIMDETEKRPLLKKVNPSELLFFIESKLREREPVYLQADYVLEATELTKGSLQFLHRQAKRS